MIRRRRTCALLAPLFLLLPAALSAQQGSFAITLPMEVSTLDNGLQVILVPDRSVPVVAVDVWYHVGAANEREGRTGFAHLFEHMMFQGSDNVDKGAHMQLVERAGGSLNGSTTADRTNYFQTLPSNRLNLGLWLEADRMRSLAVTQENLDNQIEVVKEERRLRVDNSPYGASVTAAMSEVAYNAATCFAYSHETIGSMADLEAADVDDVSQFFDTYYAPGNATLVVVGDFELADARALIGEYFGDIPAGPEAPPVECEDPFSHLPAQETFEDANANLPALFATYGMPAAGDPDVYPLRLLAAILAGGESSRLHERLVREERAAVQVFGFPDFRRGPGVFLVGAIANQGVEAERLASLIDAEMARIAAEAVSEAELVKAKNQYRSQMIRQLQTALGRAEAIQEANFLYGDPGALTMDLERTMAVTLDDLRRAASTYLVHGNRATVITHPATPAQE